VISIDPPSVDAVVTALVVVLAGGYAVPSFGALIAIAVHTVAAPLVAVLPFPLVVFGLAGVAGTYSALVRRRVGGSDRLGDLRERMDELNDEMETARTENDDTRVDELEAERERLARESLSAMKLQLRPMAYGLLASGPLFMWLRWLFAAPVAAVAPSALIVPLFGSVAWTAGIIGPLKVWVLWYLGGTMSASVVARRVAARLAS